jgi:hypothetical protein
MGVRLEIGGECECELSEAKPSHPSSLIPLMTIPSYAPINSSETPECQGKLNEANEIGVYLQWKCE